MDNNLNPNIAFTLFLHKSKGVIYSSYGEITIDLNTGKVKKIDPYYPKCEEWVDWVNTVSRFDLKEYYEYYRRDKQETDFDILDLGCWISKKYVAPSLNFRKKIAKGN